MAIVINGAGSIAGLSVGGLPDDSVDAGSLANSINTEITANTAKTGITSSQATAIGAALPKAGGTMTGNLLVNNGSSAKLGIGTSPSHMLHVVAPASIGDYAVKIDTPDRYGLRIEADGAAAATPLVILDGSTEILTLKGNGRLGIGMATPQTEMHVVTGNTSLVHIGGTSNANGNYQGISLGYSEAGNTNYRKVAVVSAGINDSSARQAFHVLVDTATDSGSTQLADSKFSVNGTTGICQARNGLTFGTDTATDNALDDYEQGTWTPAIAGTTGSFNISGTSNYTKIGNLVTVNSYIYNGTNIGNTAAEWNFTGLPYTPIRDAICAVRFHNVNIPSDVKYCVVAIQTGSSGIEVWGVRDAASMDILQWSDIGGGHVEFTCTYCSTS